MFLHVVSIALKTFASVPQTTVFFCNRFFSDAVDMLAEKESVIAKLRGLEREYRRIEPNPPDRSPDALGQLLGLIVKQKPPFRRGDDVWTRMRSSRKHPRSSRKHLGPTSF